MTEGTAYANLDHLKRELRNAVRPYRALLKHELRSANFNKRWYEQEFTSPWEYEQAYRCKHEKRHPVRWILSNGVGRVTLQCVACGDKHSTGVRKANYPNFEELPELDEGLIEDAKDALQSFREQLREAHQDIATQFEYRRQEMTELQRMAQNAEWWAKYNSYLRSPKWRSKRDRVLERDAYVCQACLKREADHAHHLTYEHVFNEPLFDLISVCNPCHKELHPHMKEGANGQPA